VTLTKNFKRFYSLRGLNESNENWEICNAKGWYGCMPNGTYKIQGVALTTLLARRRMLPPGELRCICAGVTDDDRCRRAKQYWSPYTMCKRASNKGRLQSIMKCKWTERRRSRDGDRQSDRQTDRQTDRRTDHLLYAVYGSSDVFRVEVMLYSWLQLVIQCTDRLHTNNIIYHTRNLGLMSGYK